MKAWWLNKKEITRYTCQCCKTLTMWLVGTDKSYETIGQLFMCDKCD